MNFIDDYVWEDYESVESTNDLAIEKSFNQYNKKFVITAKKQTKGRGRRGRDWISLDGNLFASLAIEFELRFLGHLSVIVSLSLFETLKSYDENLHVNTKWPNDILINHSKAIGVLIEKGDKDYFVIGVGVNICQSPVNSDLLYPTTNLKEQKIETDRIEFLKKFIKIFNANIKFWNEFGFEKIKQKWQQNLYALNKEIVVNSEREMFKGILKGINDDGTLLLELPDGQIKKILAGDVFLLKEKK